MASIADLIAAGPGGSERSSSSSSAAPSRLGLPEGGLSGSRVYARPRNHPHPVTGTRGGFVGAGTGADGFGYTEDDALRVLSGMSPEKLARVQQQMKTAGLIGPETKFTIGSMDRTTRGAFGELLEISNLSSTSWDKTLTDLGTRAAAAGGTDDAAREELEKTRRELLQRRDEAIRGFGTSLNTYQRPDPAAVRSTAEQAFREALGRRPNAKELAVFTDRFIRSEMASQRTVFDAQDANQAADRTRTLQGFDAALGGLDAGGTASGDPVEALLRAVGSQESGNNYNARNGRTGASGKYQIMPASWGPWSREAGLPAGAPRTPENQERVARFKMGQYVQQFGQQGAAVAWYAGPSAAKAWVKNSEASRFTRKQGRGNEPSINEYVQQVTARMATGGKTGNTGGARFASAKNEPDELWNRLQAMIRDAPGKIKPGPRSRDYATQVRLWKRYQAGGPQAAKPGTSKHGDGRANDLTYENDAVRQWALANAAKYGLAFPIYDPKKKRSHDESWHVELGGSPGNSYGTPAGPPTAAPLSATVVNQQQDAGAQAVEFARTANPIESRAFDIGGQFNNLISILGRSVI